jgi:anti-anti-sigma factor
MRLTEAEIGNVKALMLDGPLDQEGAAELLPAVDTAIEAQHTRFVIDLSESPHVDSIGLESLVSIASRIFRFGGRLGLFGVTETFGEILRVTGLDQRFAIFGSREEALARVREDD